MNTYDKNPRKVPCESWGTHSERLHRMECSHLPDHWVRPVLDGRAYDHRPPCGVGVGPRADPIRPICVPRLRQQAMRERSTPIPWHRRGQLEGCGVKGENAERQCGKDSLCAWTPVHRRQHLPAPQRAQGMQRVPPRSAGRNQCSQATKGMTVHITDHSLPNETPSGTRYAA